MKWLKKHRKKGTFVILFAIMLTILWPIQTGIGIDSSAVPLIQKQLKEALIAATKSAAGQLDQAQLHQGNYLIDQNQATQVFGKIMEDNLRVNPTTWEPEGGSAVKSPLHVKAYLYNQWSSGSLPGTASTLLNTGPGSPSDSLYPPLQDVSIPSVAKPTILAVASETYTSFWGKKVVIEQFASAQADYALNGHSTSLNPVVQSVTFTGSPYGPIVTIQGIGFGEFSTPYTGDPNALTFRDTTRAWEQGNTGDSVTDHIISWSDSQIVASPSGMYNNFAEYVYEPGDAVSVFIANPQTKNAASYNTTVSYPFAATITANPVSATYQNGYGNNSNYQVNIPFSYAGYSAGHYNIAVVDGQGNTVTSADQNLGTSGTSQISWSATYPNAQQTWHLVETDWMGRTVAQSNSETGNPPAPPSNMTVYSGSWLRTPTQSFYFTPSTSGNYTLNLGIYNPPSWTYVYLVDTVTGQQVQIATTQATNLGSCPNECSGYMPSVSFGNTVPYTFTIPVSLNGGHQYRLYDTGNGGYIDLIQFTH